MAAPARKTAAAPAEVPAPAALAEVPSPAPLIGLNLAFAASRMLMTAVELDLFGTLDGAPATEAELRRRLNLHPRYARTFLDALLAHGLLRREDDRYHNTELAAMFLVPGKPRYIGGFIEVATRVQWQAWSRFTRALRTGEHQDDSPVDDGNELFRTRPDEDPDRIRRFMAAMDTHTGRAGTEIAERIDWSGYESVADLGGARGNLLAHLVRRLPGVRGVNVDRAPARPFFDEHVAALGVADRVSFLEADFFHDPLPATDVLVYGHVLHEWSQDTRAMLVRRAYEALPPAGSLVIYDRMLDDEAPDRDALLLSLTFMLTSPGGGEYRISECDEWLREAGFQDISFTPVLDNHTLAIARK
ncbi:methyltransferase [Streptomyces winkii]|uniref:methyltransferase n=1 Tax=Streptomyces winkii TaxID=3051178 RepID=UPI0028D6667A|nr:methyltransferase [Streptomyces sp. DSM 40971]